MDNPGTSLIVKSSQALIVADDPYIQHLAALLLVRLHRTLGFVPLTRIVLVCRRVVVFHLPLSFTVAFCLEIDEYFSHRARLPALLIRTSAGCALVVDLDG